MKPILVLAMHVCIEMDIGIRINISLAAAHMQTLTYLPRQISTQELTEVVIFDEVPSGTLHGDGFAEDIGLQQETMRFDFRVVRVEVRVRWKDHDSGDPSAVLTLKRKTKNQILGELDLAEYDRGSTPDEVTTVTFDLKPDDQNPFWQTGATGKFESDLHSRNSSLTMLQSLASQQATTVQASRLFCIITSAMKSVS